jgi:hypothetical protein
VLAIALVVSAFLLVLREAWRGTLRLGAIVGVAVALHLLAVAMPLFISHDVYHYSMYGRIASVHHENPYVATPDQFPDDPLFPLISEEWRDAPAFYGPVMVHLSTAITGSVEEIPGLIWSFKVLAGLSSLIVLLLVVRMSRRLWPERAAFAAAMVGLNPVVLFNTVAGGHIDPLIGLGLVLAFSVVAGGWIEQAGKVGWAAELLVTAILTVVAMIKSPLAVVLVVFVATRIWRRAGRGWLTAGAHVVVVAFVALAAAWPFLQLEDPTLGTTRLAGFLNFLSPTVFFWLIVGTVGRAIGGDAVGEVLAGIVRLAFPVVFVWALVAVLRATRRRLPELDPVGEGAAWAWALVLLILTAPILWPWYLLWVLPLAWLLPLAPRIAVVVASSALPLFQTLGERAKAPTLDSLTIALGIALVSPVLLVLLFRVLKDLRKRVKEGVPLESEP